MTDTEIAEIKARCAEFEKYDKGGLTDPFHLMAVRLIESLEAAQAEAERLREDVRLLKHANGLANETAVGLQAEIATLVSALEEAQRALEGVREMGGKCIYNFDDQFRAGSAAAFGQCAEMTSAALASIEKALKPAR